MSRFRKIFPNRRRKQLIFFSWLIIYLLLVLLKSSFASKGLDEDAMVWDKVNGFLIMLSAIYGKVRRERYVVILS